jgi:plastocyanin
MMGRHIDSTTSTAMALLLWVVSCAVVHAETIEVIVVDPDGVPVPEVAVFVEQDGIGVLRAPPELAVMDQRDKRFVPHVLVVQKGASVLFPNSDVIGHQVYSFSKPNNFVLPLYTGDPHDPVTFDHDGIVMLGCNIHDHMLAYIVVVDTDVFGLTDESGSVLLNIADSTTSYSVNIWSPRIRDGKQELTKRVGRPSTTNSKLTFVLQRKLRAPHHQQTEAVQWSEY